MNGLNALTEGSDCKPQRQLEELSLLESLVVKKDKLEERLATVNEAINALNKNPEVARVFNLILKSRNC